MKKEIIALINATGVDGQQKKKNIWIGELQLIAWKDTVIHTEEKVVYWTTTYDGLVEMANIISKNMIIKLVVEEKETHFNLLEIVQAPVADDELEIIKQKSQKSIYYQDNILGKFKYDKQFDWFTKRVDWNNEKGDVYIYNAEPNVLHQQFEYLATLLNPNHLQEIKRFAAEQLAPLAEEWGDKSLSVSDLLKKLKFKELVMNKKGDFTVHLGSRKLFGDHMIQVEGHATEGLKSAHI